MTEQERQNYCKDCDRSIWGKYHDCDMNIENNGYYNHADDKCFCKIVNGKRAEIFSWEEAEENPIIEKINNESLVSAYMETGITQGII